MISGGAISEFPISTAPAAAAVPDVVPSVPGIELALGSDRTHYGLRDDRTHYSLSIKRLHWNVPEEDS